MECDFSFQPVVDDSEWNQFQAHLLIKCDEGTQLFLKYK